MGGLRTLFGALAFASGIVLADGLNPAGRTAVIAGIAGSVFLITAAALHFRNPAPGPGSLLPIMSAATMTLAGAGLAACGFSSLGLRLSAVEGALVPGHEGDKVQLTGRLANDPRPNEYSSRFLLAVRQVEGRKVREKVAVTAYGRLPALDLGDRIRITAKIRRLDETDDYDASLARKSIVAKVSVSGPDIRRLSGPQNPALIAANHFRSRIAAAARAGAGEGRSGLLLALVMGDQRRIPQAVIDDFRAAGLSHLSAVSGQNVAMVLAPLVVVLTALHLGRGGRMAISLVVLALFAVVTRWEPSVLRAVLTASAGLSAWLFGRRSDAVHLLGLVFFALLAIDPFLLWSIGFQLSFAATAGILLMGPYLAARLGRPIAGRDPGQGGGSLSGAPGLKGRLVQAAAIGIAAQTAVLPLIAWHFGRVSLVSLPANLVALPLVAPVTVLGLLGGLIGLLSIELARPFMFVAGLCVSGLQGIARLFGRSAYSQISVDGWSLLQFTALGLAIASAALWLNGKGRAARWPAAICVIAAVMAGLLPAAGSAPPGGMRLTFFDVGQGDAALIESPSGARVLVDGGPDAGYVARRLKQMAASRLDLVVASHGHIDHVEGLSEVFRRFEVRAAVDPGIPTPMMRKVTAAARNFTRGITPASDNETIKIGDLTVDFLGPSPLERDAVLEGESERSTGPEGTDLNDASVVARVSFGRQCALFPGDLELEGQEALLHAHGNQIDCTILKAPHHGSGRLVPGFVRAVDPEWVTISVGRGNDYGHPAGKALGIFEDAGARVLRTDRMGDIILDMDRDGRVTLKR